NKATRDGTDVLIHFSLLGEQARCQHPNLTAAYLGNLSRLGVIEIPLFYQYTDQGVYKPLEEAPAIVTLKQQIESDATRTAVITRQAAKPTPMGMQFMRACVIPHESKRPSRKRDPQQTAQSDIPEAGGTSC